MDSILTGALVAEVMAELPSQERTPRGPSAILMAGMPRRATGMDSIHPEPASMEISSSRVMRESRLGDIACSTGRAEFL